MPVLEYNDRQQIEGIGLLRMDFEDSPVGLMGAFQVAAVMQRQSGIEQLRKLCGQHVLHGRIAGATPVAIANMNALTGRYGPSPKAFLVIPLIGAFFVDIMNALVTKTFLALPMMQQGAS